MLPQVNQKRDVVDRSDSITLFISIDCFQIMQNYGMALRPDFYMVKLKNFQYHVRVRMISTHVTSKYRTFASRRMESFKDSKYSGCVLLTRKQSIVNRRIYEYMNDSIAPISSIDRLRQEKKDSPVLDFKRLKK